MLFPMQPLSYRSRQRGAVLFVALVFLLLLTLLGVTASSTSILQERMTGGMRNAHLAGIGVESGLRGGEVDLWAAAARSNTAAGGIAIPPCASSGVQPCRYMRTNGIVDQRVDKFRTATAWLDTGTDGAKAFDQDMSTQTSTDLKSSNLASQPRYIIEDLGLDTGDCCGNMGGAILGAPQGSGAPSVHQFRVTARSQGASTALMRAAESVFGANSITNFNPGNN
jgi:type IV pilus assembly protein PilX